MPRGIPRIDVRPLSSSDVRLLHELWRDSGLSFKQRGRDRLELLRAQRRRSPDLFLGAFSEGELVGSVIASDDGRRGWINRLAVRPSVRRKGVAKALVLEAEDALRKRGRHLFCIHVERDNESSMRLFEKAGYALEKDIFYFTKRERRSY
jgi:ribosomal protein S18 acetylase RimI-like enzyme